MAVQVRGPHAGGFNIIVATSNTLEGPYSLGPATPPPLDRAPPGCHAPVGGYCECPDATPTHTAAGVLRSGAWPQPTYAAAAAAVGALCDADPGCAAFGLGTDAR